MEQDEEKATQEQQQQVEQQRELHFCTTKLKVFFSIRFNYHDYL